LCHGLGVECDANELTLAITVDKVDRNGVCNEATGVRFGEDRFAARRRTRVANGAAAVDVSLVAILGEVGALGGVWHCSQDRCGEQ
jgi:hypothetical protein